MTNLVPLFERYQYVQALVTQACQQAQRDQDSVMLLAVSKTHATDKIRQLYAYGQRAFGENYLQEAMDKQQELTDCDIEWHFIGHVQRNKTKLLAQQFSWVHGVDRLIIAERLAQQRPVDLPALNICLQVNIDLQQTKDGCHPDDVLDLVHHMSSLDRLRLRGLMVIPAPDSVGAFGRTRQLFEQAQAVHQHPQHWDTLSMGMSADLSQAIQAGSTLVRVGTALFGQR